MIAAGSLGPPRSGIGRGRAHDRAGVARGRRRALGCRRIVGVTRIAIAEARTSGDGSRRYVAARSRWQRPPDPRQRPGSGDALGGLHRPAGRRGPPPPGRGRRRRQPWSSAPTAAPRTPGSASSSAPDEGRIGLRGRRACQERRRHRPACPWSGACERLDQGGPDVRRGDEVRRAPDRPRAAVRPAPDRSVCSRLSA